MIVSRVCLVVLSAAIVAGCAAPVNLPAKREAMLAADIRFDELSGESGPDYAFSRYLVREALRLPRNGPAVSGLDNIVKSLAGDYTLRWKPRDAVVSKNADMGYTWGNWVLTVDTDSGVMERRGKYLNVWVYRSGEWKVLVDIGNQADPMPE